MKLSTSYIANVNRISQYHLDVLEDLNERLFPGIISNEIHPKEFQAYPLCSEEVARTTMENRLSMLRDPMLHFFIMFLDDSQHNEIAAFELGVSVQTKATIVLLGSKYRSGITIFKPIDKIVKAYDWDDFIEIRFKI